jgi:hypothetical protein
MSHPCYESLFRKRNDALAFSAFLGIVTSQDVFNREKPGDITVTYLGANRYQRRQMRPHRQLIQAA